LFVGVARGWRGTRARRGLRETVWTKKILLVSCVTTYCCVRTYSYTTPTLRVVRVLCTSLSVGAGPAEGGPYRLPVWSATCDVRARVPRPQRPTRPPLLSRGERRFVVTCCGDGPPLLCQAGPFFHSRPPPPCLCFTSSHPGHRGRGSAQKTYRGPNYLLFNLVCESLFNLKFSQIKKLIFDPP
jgi:hypothetical protein